MKCATCSRPLGECWAEYDSGPICLDCDNGRDPEELRAGDAVLWKWEPRGGYCVGHWVPAIVVSVGPKRITIAAELSRGGTKEVAVKPERLKRRKESVA